MTTRLFHALFISAGLVAGSVLAAEARQEIDLPAGPLAAGVEGLAHQTGLQILFEQRLLDGKRSGGLKGRLTAAEALEKLLAGSGLRAVATAGAYAIRPASTPAPRRGTEGAGDAELPAITITATRTERPITDVPASVSVITAKEIAQQQPRMVSDLLRNLEGIDTAANPALGATEGVMVRGVPGSFSGATTQLLIDGMPINSPVARVSFGIKGLTPFDLEQVDVVRGPASALYGAGAMGGVINFIPKRWKGAPGAEVELGAGSHNATQVSAAVGAASEVADFRLSATDYRTDGFIAQNEPWGRDLAPRDGQRQLYSLTAGLRPAEGHEITLTARHSDTSSADLGGAPQLPLEPRGTEL